MCGIAGTFAAGPVAADPDQHRGMAQRLVHRGPDLTRVHPLPGGGLVSTRLAIIDPVGAGQPVAGCTTAVVCVYNGEIYNYQELRGQLLARGHRLCSQGDGEVITHLYEEHGRHFVDHLRGAFAIALYDAHRDELILARDRMGEKPLVYTASGTTICFASETRALEAATELGAVSSEALGAFLLYGFVPEPDTLFRDVRKIPAGHYAVVRRTPAFGVTLHRYWSLPAPADTGGHDDRGRAELISSASAILAEAVAQQTRADVPVGVALSGGIDSTLLARLSARSLTDLRTYSVGFDWTPSGEPAAAAATARTVQGKHTEIRLSVHDYLELLNEGSRKASEPIADWTMPAYLALTTRCQGDGVRVLLTGHGPDEIFLAYRWTRQANARIRSTKDTVDTIDAYQFNPEYREAADLLGSVLAAAGGQVRADGLGSCTRRSSGAFRHALRSALMRGYLRSNGLMQLDSLGLMKAVEVRVPYVDYRFVEAAATLDDLGCADAAVPKGALYAMADVLQVPNPYVEKRPFFPSLTAVAAPIAAMARDVIRSGELVTEGIIAPQTVQTLLNSLSSDGSGLTVLFRLFVAEMWLTHLRRPGV
jgi:asparagine synthase (glutamine-hydrolysing)